MGASLPSHIAAALDTLAAGQEGAALRAAAERLSLAYRDSLASTFAIRTEADALAYAISRMPATYAAISVALAELAARAPGFAPVKLTDAGAGPGTATWAAADVFPSLVAAELRDTNPRLLALARHLAGHAADLSADIRQADLTAAAGQADLVTCAYALTELGDSALLPAARKLWAETTGALVLVEPGRPRDFARLLAIRTALIGEGATVLSPCPHHADCPLVEPDWCHFSTRLPRSRAHMQMKGGTLGYEDEKFSYLILVRPGIGRPAPARLIKPVLVNKHEARLPLCSAEGHAVTLTISSRDRAAFKAARKAEWGDAIDRNPNSAG